MKYVIIICTAALLLPACQNKTVQTKAENKNFSKNLEKLKDSSLIQFTGSITDSSNTPRGGLSVHLKYSEHGTWHRALSSSDGTFRITVPFEKWSSTSGKILLQIGSGSNDKKFEKEYEFEYSPKESMPVQYLSSDGKLTLRKDSAKKFIIN